MSVPHDLSRIRHDLRTPLNHLLGYCELLLEDEALPTAFRPDLERIRTGGRQLLDALNEYLDVRRLQAGPLDLNRLQHDLRTPVNHIRGYGEMLEELALEMQAEAYVDDLRRIQQAAATWLRLMEERLMPLGEALTSEGRPAPLVGGPAIAFAAPRPSSAAQGGGRVLVVDDDPSNRDILSRYLSRDGYEVVTEVDGLRALARLQAGGHGFDLVLLDLLMPGLNGYEMLLRLKSDPALRDLPVLIISGLDLENGIARCIEAGADDYLTKPFNAVLLRARLASCLEKKRLRDHERTLAEGLRREQERSEQLLLNVLPAAIAARLKRGETNLVDATAAASVLFVDLVGFTQLAATLPASATVQLLDEIFCGFDELADRHGVTKIKTIGDAWMAVSGVPEAREDHATAAADLALGLVAFFEDFSRRTEHTVQVRVGIHCGPVVAGVIGRHRFSYDLWGDTVNTASRMESHGTPGQIQVSQAFRDQLGDAFVLEERGSLSVKGKGEMTTWFLRSRR